MAQELPGKVAVVTGGSQGIGAACAHALAHEGCDLLLVASTAERLAETARRISDETGRRVETCATDLRRLDGCEEAAAAARHLAGRCDILVNCAGATKGGA